MNMFNKQKIAKNTVMSEGHETCAECGAWIDKINKVCYVHDYIPLLGYSPNFCAYFCHAHKRPYEKKVQAGEGWKYYKTIPEHEVEVDENGKELKVRKHA